MTNKKLAIRWQSILEEHPSGHSVANQAKVKISLFKCKRVHEWASSECLPVSKLLDPFFCPDFAFSFVNLSFVFNVCLSSMLNTRLDRFFFQMIYARLCVCWHILIDGQSAVKIFLFVFFQAVFMQTLQFLLQPSFACSRFAKSHAFAAGASGHSTGNLIFTVFRSGHSTRSCILQLSNGVIQRRLVQI